MYTRTLASSFSRVTSANCRLCQTRPPKAHRSRRASRSMPSPGTAASDLPFCSARSLGRRIRVRRFPLHAHDVADRFHGPLAAFVDMLNAMRFGQLSPEMIQAFRGLSREVTYSDGIEPTELSVCVPASMICAELKYPGIRSATRSKLRTVDVCKHSERNLASTKLRTSLATMTTAILLEPTR